MNPIAIERATATRQGRAQEQALNYGLFQQANGVYSVISRQGKVYEATSCTCTCPDYAYRGSKALPPIPCKHQFLVREEEARLERERAERALIISNARAKMALDFPVTD